MGSSFPKYIYDPIHELIEFADNDCDRLLLALIETREFQRLRRVRQLGMTSLVFPGANHSRFSHALGVLALTRKFLRQVRNLGRAVQCDHRAIVLSAALLHDIGHGPFSHVFEKISGESHEKRTAEIILGDTEVNSVLVGFGIPHLPRRIAAFFYEDAPDIEEPDENSGGGCSDPQQDRVPSYLVQLVSSQLDADRFDYLLRDSHFTGVNYGNFDHRWLIGHLEFGDPPLDERLVLTEKARSSAETYVFARYHMYRSVYFHKTTRAAETMLRLLFKRFSELADKDPEEATKLVPGVPQELVAAFTGQCSLEEYINMDDDLVSIFMRQCEQSRDDILARLGAGLTNRRLYKCIDLSAHHVDDLMAINEARDKYRDELRDAKKIPDYWFAQDSPADAPYRPYSPTSDTTPLLIKTASGTVELSQLSKPVSELTKYAFDRYYFPEDTRDRVSAIFDRILR